MFNRRLVAQLRWEWDDLVQALGTWRFYATLLATTMGCVTGAIAINGILIPRNLFSPGTSGVSLLLYYAFGHPSLGVIYLLLNIPLFIVGWREYALRYVVISGYGVVAFSVALELTQSVVIRAPDPMMAALIGGVLMGAGTGFYLRMGGSAGGLDILGTYIRKKFGVPIGSTLNAVNAINLIGALILFDLSTAFYSAVFMWVNSWTLEKMQTGFSQHRAIFIITAEPESVARAIRSRLNRGVTFFDAAGGFSGRPLRVLYTVINMYELGRLKDLMFTLDPAAYVMVTNTTEVIGRRFHTWEQEGYRKRFEWTHPSPPPAPVADSSRGAP